MAAKSDLGQKLLHDLRLRKERMNAAQSYGNSGGYANAGQSNRGSRQIKTLESVGSRTRSSNRSFQAQESSGQIVPYAAGRAQSSGNIDLSMAISFAIENRGKFTTKLSSSGNNPMLGFLQQVGQRSLDLGKLGRSSFDSHHHRPSSSHIVTLSNAQVNEISRGIQKINQILRVCSNGVNIDRYSIEVGKELLKGAMDLESSLRMLVNLQEASNHMISSQRKNRITLLEEDEDDDDAAKTEDHKQLDLPRFSFDKPRKSTSKRRVLALTYPEETLKPNEKKPLGPSNMASHKRSSSAQDFKALPTAEEKGRISNVIAKLMGLDEIPQTTDVKSSRKSTSKKKETPEVKKSANSENIKPPQIADRKTKETKNMLSSQDNIVVLKDDTISHQKEVKLAVKQESGSGLITATATVKHQTNITQIYEHPGINLRKEKESRNSDNIKRRQTETLEISELSPQKHRKNIHHQTESKVPERLVPGNQQENTETSQLQKPRKSDGTDNKDRNLAKQRVEIKARTSATLRNKAESVYKKQPSPTNPTFARHKKNPVTTQSVDKKGSPKELTPRIQEKAIKVPVIKKKESYIDGKRGSPKPKAEPLKQKLPILQVKKQLKNNVDNSKLSKDNSEESKGNSSEVSKSEVGNEPQEKSHCDMDESCYVVGENKCRNYKDAMELSEIEQEDVNQETDSPNTTQNQQEEHKEISNVFEDKDTKIVPKQQKDTFATPAQPEPLTESEKQLKESLIKSHQFLSTAEALLKLNLPISVLHSNDHINQGAECKLTVDCGYEVMRRKARRQELSLHPFSRISVSRVKIRSLDDLIKQLCKEFEKLRSYGGESCDSTEFFQNVLEKDMQNCDPDINSMWEFDWEEPMFGFWEKDDIAKDVEKHLLRGLIDEITIDLL